MENTKKHISKLRTPCFLSSRCFSNLASWIFHEFRLHTGAYEMRLALLCFPDRREIATSEFLFGGKWWRRKLIFSVWNKVTRHQVTLFSTWVLLSSVRFVLFRIHGIARSRTSYAWGRRRLTGKNSTASRISTRHPPRIFSPGSGGTRRVRGSLLPRTHSTRNRTSRGPERRRGHLTASGHQLVPCPLAKGTLAT